MLGWEPPPERFAMRRLWLVVVAMIFASCGMAYGGGAKMTVKDLRGLLAQMQADHKSDELVANRLKEVKLSEPLTPEAMNSLVDYQPGPLTIVQLQVLGLETALLAPPAEELPKAAAPDAAAQGAMLKRLVEYITKQYAQVPRLSAEKKTARFQNGPDAFHPGTGQRSQMAISDPGVKPPDPYFRSVGQTRAEVVVQAGFELPGKKVTPHEFAKQNAQAAPTGMVPVLGMVLEDAAQGKMGWARWQMIDGKQTAVYAFSVPAKISHYDVSYCCFPVMEVFGGSTQGIGAWGVSNDYEEFHTKPGYHGELFLDPATGVVVRLIFETDFKTSHLVLQEDTRIDYAPVRVGAARYVLPSAEIRQTTFIPYGESFRVAAKQTILAKAEYSNYR